MVRLALVGTCATLLAALVAGCGGSGGAGPATTARQLRQFRIVFPEGFTRARMAGRVGAVAKIAERKGRRKVKLSKSSYLAATARPRVIQGFGRKAHPLEGFLFPDTYDFDRTSTSAYLVREQLGTFQLDWRRLNLSYARSRQLTPYDVLTIASMIEAEVSVPGERRLVSAVIYNRLRLGMPLQIDATTRYGLHIPPTKPLTQAELASNNPYNTRNRKGLPPTPIDNPGLASMQAAAHPAPVDYLYYVRKPDGRHHYFTASYQDFVNHEIQYGYVP